ncbi:hypothetical protein ZIOFF_023899 [Zingiber officinale]|uniref:GATA-type domain-containing protein n=2 Tax=Zingiber officinale TaxID=94328 RepID=A0A8J5GVF7_ZINOF|nr:hypothetical protein ZIOFF_023899 [Zingiber officinale]
MATAKKREVMEDGMGDLFDHIEDFLDFPGEEDVFGLMEPCGGMSGALLLPPLPVPVADELLGDGVGEDSLDGFITADNKAGVDFSKEDDKWDEIDIMQLEWMSKFLDDPESSLGLHSGGGDAVDKSATSDDRPGETKADQRCFFRTSSPVSVLEPSTNTGGRGISESSSSSSYSSSSTSASYFIGGKKDTPLSRPEPPTVLAVPARARTKRARPAAFVPRPHVVVPCSPPAPTETVAALPSPLSSESFEESSFRAPPRPLPSKKSKKRNHPTDEGDYSCSPPAVRKCLHCEITKTPQWRAGPLGPKTLCNACGVRYKSGRLFPEYRPAASPTFVPAVHSNSHRKVVEMRNMADHNTVVTDDCDLLEYIRRRA